MKRLIALAMLLMPLLMGAKDKDGIKLAQLDKAREAVWKEWCEKLAKEDTLPAFSTEALEKQNTMRWHLPGELEPNAIMPFYSGTKGEKPEKGFPVFIYIHGSGPKDAEWTTGLKLAQVFDDTPSLYLVPQIPNEGEYYRWWQKAKQWAWRHTLEKLLSHPDVDPARIYCLASPKVDMAHSDSLLSTRTISLVPAPWREVNPYEMHLQRTFAKRPSHSSPENSTEDFTATNSHSAPRSASTA